MTRKAWWEQGDTHTGLGVVTVPPASLETPRFMEIESCVQESLGPVLVTHYIEDHSVPTKQIKSEV